MLDVIVLGSAAGGGFPQWNSAAPACLRAYNRQGTKPRTQASIAVSADGQHWFLINASPDLRQQILSTPALQHKGSHRGTPIQGVILTGAEIDTTVGLFTMREREPFTLMASASSLAQLDANPMFEALDRELVTRYQLPLKKPISLTLKDGQPSGLTLEAFPVPGKAPLYAEKNGTNLDDSLGLSISDGQKTLLYVPGCAHINDELLQRVATADLFFFDGTLWQDDEMVRAGLSMKTGHRMGHVSVSGDDGPLRNFAEHPNLRKVLIHINNSNPILLEDTPQRRMVEDAGWIVAEDGMTFRLEAA
ncbi:pyrroloquinoline quinone biosynthesis protein PqqB [Saccharibacter sp. 17.LH.SD]|uniref:pyrroloquinoline quinone biosynthesis protein PqqB n=1 Tax=Saccharibacter sp. 17.LH.SD TaxID=2689393 RepID=UPI00136F0C2B|nr:pyrroloquinoline quinone biosynthesis protein PqqB [Saccharibacter sp. 17.LH.SD]MXV45214.1 pyrroloquinoline quinone biosynthesis protein PqqB [Saccharibacter sp. 17.LH.SD]